MVFKDKNIEKETKKMNYEDSVNWIMKEAHQTTKGFGVRFWLKMALDKINNSLRKSLVYARYPAKFFSVIRLETFLY